MYLEYYGLLKEPFHITPDPDFLYMSPSHREAFAALVYGVEQRKGFIAMTGEVGAGKTTILRAFMKRVDEKAVRPVYLFNPALTYHELLVMTMRGLGLTPDSSQSGAELLDQLNWALIEEYRAGRNVVLLVDEAQNMPVETLEQLRMLSNLETANDKLLQIVLVGQPELEDKLNLHELRQLKQRCAVRSIVKPLARDESAEYIKHRLHMAGCPRDEVFSPAALRAIVSHAKGSPRTLNILCDNAMIAGFGSQQTLISAAIVRSVIRDMGATSRSKQAPRWAWAGAIAAGGIVIGAVVSQVGLLGGNASNGSGVMTVEAGAATPMPETPSPSPTPAQAPATPVQVAKAAPAPTVAPAPEPNASPEDNASPEPVTVDAAAPTPTHEPAEASVAAPVPTPEPAAPSVKPAMAPAPVAPKAPAPTAVESLAAALKQRDEEKRAVETAEPAAQAPASDPEPVKPIALAKANMPAAAPKESAPAKPLAQPQEAVAQPQEAVAQPQEAVAQPQEAVAQPQEALETASTPLEIPKPAKTPKALQTAKNDVTTEPAPQKSPQPVVLDGPAATATQKAPSVAPEAAMVAATEEPEQSNNDDEITPAPAPAAGTTTLSADDIIERRVVTQGDCLSRLASEIYGSGQPNVVRALHRYNPQIVNPDYILPGQTVVFPVAVLVGAETAAGSTAMKAGAAPAGGANP